VSSSKWERVWCCLPATYLLRHRLIELRDKVSLDLRPLENRREPKIKNYQRVYMTALGFNFVKACRKPEATHAETSKPLLPPETLVGD
jgi:hypothetical protein